MPGCEAGQALCGEVCADTLTDAAHCGGCDSACPADEVCYEGGCSPCGNGVWEAGEQCDDGNSVSGDGCSDACAYEGPPGSITYTFVAVVGYADHSDGYLPAAEVGDTLVGRYTFAPFTPDSDATAPDGLYVMNQAGYGLTVSVRGVELGTDAADPIFNITVDDADGLEIQDVLWFRSIFNLATPAPASFRLEWLLYDGSKTTLGAPYLPTATPVLSDWNQQLTIACEDDFVVDNITATVLWVGP